jgi:hypothetical protein
MNTNKKICFLGIMCCFSLYSLICDEIDVNLYITIVNEFSEIIQKYSVLKTEINSLELDNIINLLNNSFFEPENHNIKLITYERTIEVNVDNNVILMSYFGFYTCFLPQESAIGMCPNIIGVISVNNKYYQIFFGHDENNKSCLMFFDKNDDDYIYINYFYPNEYEIFIKLKCTNTSKTEFFLETSVLVDRIIIYNGRYYE